jgi:WD40 repeat protein
VATGEVTGTTPLGGDPQVILSQSPDQRRLFLLNRRGSVVVWDLAQERAVGSIRSGRGAAGASAAVAPDGRRLVTSSAGEIKVWELLLP